MMIRKYGLSFVWVIATLGAFGSLFVSEILNTQPCLLSWFQRICLFPLVIIAGQAAWHGDYRIASYLLPQTIIGLFIALFQIVLQETSWLPFFPSCSIRALVGLGPISAAMLSALTFLLINSLLIPISKIGKSIPQL